MSVNSKMTAIADAIRSKTGGSEALTLDQMVTEINSIETGVELPELTTPADVTEVFSGKEYIDASGEIQTGTFSIDDELSTQDDLIAQIQSAVDSLPEAGGEAEPTLQNKTVTPTASSQTITADSGYDGLDVVTVNAIPSTYVKPTATKGATTYTPTTTNQTIAAGTYCSGDQTIMGDANLVPANIVSGVSIFGVNGSAEVGENNNAGSASVEMIKITIMDGWADEPTLFYPIFYYVDENLTFCQKTFPFISLSIPKNSFFVVSCLPNSVTYYGFNKIFQDSSHIGLQPIDGMSMYEICFDEY